MANRGLKLGSIGGVAPCCCGPGPATCSCVPTTGTLTATDTFFGLTWTLTFSGSTSTGWSGSAVYAYPGNATCDPTNTTLTLLLKCPPAAPTTLLGQLSWRAGGTSLACGSNCPNIGAGVPAARSNISVTGTCSPLSVSFTIPAESGNCAGSPTSWGVLANGNADTFTIT